MTSERVGHRWVWDGENWVWPLPGTPPSPPPPRAGSELDLRPGDTYEYDYDERGLFDFHVEIDAWFAEHTRPGTGLPTTPRGGVDHAPRALPPLPPPPPTAHLRGPSMLPRPPERLADGTAQPRRPYPSQCRPLFPEHASTEEKEYQELLARAGRLGSFSSRFTLTIDAVVFVLAPSAIAPLNRYLLDWNARAVEMARHVPVYDAGRLVACVRRVLEVAYRRLRNGESQLGHLMAVEGNLYPMEQPWWVRFVPDGDRIRVTSLRWEAWPDHR
jgi:hypothetical protein